MSCITELLKLKGDRKFWAVTREGNKKPWIVIEGGGSYKDYEYLIVFISMGHRCGYVAIPENHKYSKETDYNDLFIDCHGGLTFMSPDHVLKDLLSNPSKEQWIGFDCAHCYDMPDKEAYIEYFNDHNNEYISAYADKFAEHGCTVKSYKYVENDCKRIIDQLIEKAA